MTASLFYRAAIRGIDDITEATTAHQQQVEQINASTIHTAEAKRDRVRAAADQFHAQLRDLSATVTDKLDQADKRAAAILAGDRSNTEQENRKHRAAGRVTRLLDAGKNPAEAAEVFAASGDVDAYQALRDEVPAWVAATLPAGELNTAAEHTRRMLLLVDTTMAPALDGEMGNAARIRGDIDTQRARLTAAKEYAVHPSPSARLTLAFANEPAA
ncbi:hypothetical protein GCM10010169_23410 [Micromonospora fulviviridis]|uniref:hypothetical protein n=1 Tax=Micromonospora fulviviridis TaxID=47860 RepID=UPI001666AAEC|nr:hypothetical protein [Micromonospora fulviviridis]GGR78553.1 hypothetical protein GCM10010169_23410 [Micromonospora fulviviridis]